MKESYIATIVHHKIETPLIISSDSPQLLIIENPHEFYSLVRELKSRFEGNDGDFILLQNETRCAFDKLGDMSHNIFDLDFGDKKLTALLNKNLEKISCDGELKLMQSNLNTMISEYYYELFERLSLPITFDDAEVGDILKAGKVRLKNEYDGLLEMVVGYINAMVQLKNCKFFVFVNLKSVLPDDELIQLYKHCSNEKVGLLLIESNICRAILDIERAVIITEDLCEIVDKNIGL